MSSSTEGHRARSGHLRNARFLVVPSGGGLTLLSGGGGVAAAYAGHTGACVTLGAFSLVALLATAALSYVQQREFGKQLERGLLAHPQAASSVEVVCDQEGYRYLLKFDSPSEQAQGGQAKDPLESLQPTPRLLSVPTVGDMPS